MTLSNLCVQVTLKHLPHQPNQSKTIFLVRLRCSNRKLTRKLFHNRQTKLSGYSTSGRIKPSCYSSLLFRRLFHSALNLNVATQRMGNGNKVLATKTSSLSRQVPLLQHEADERVIPHQPTSHATSGHSHIWLLSLLPKEVNSSVQVHWQQWWPLMLF